MAFLPLLFFLFVSAIIFQQSSSGLRESLLKGSLITFVVIWLTTELLSLKDLIAYREVLIAWIGLNLLGAGWLAWMLFRRSSLLAGKWQSLKHDFLTSLSGISILCLITIVVIGGITLYIALKAPPNNYDSMTYHMARIPHWIQNHNIKYYPTSIPRQNYSLPVAEFSIMHLQLLSQGDRFANLVQWFSFLMAILSSSLIAKQLKISPRGQWIAGALTASLPMAILQSTTTQNDLVVGLFCLSFAYFLGKTAQNPSWKSGLFTALSLGLALGTKGTAYIFCAGLGIGLGGFSLIGKSWQEIKRLSLHYGLIIVVALSLNGGIYLRNWRLYRHPLITSNERVLVDELSWKVLAANTLRNGVMHLASPIQPVNRALQEGTAWLLGYQLENPASTFQNTSFSLTFSINEDDAGNGLHFLLIGLAGLVLPWMKKGKDKDINRFLATLVFTFLIYSLAFKWQPWGGRLQTPLFLAGTAAAAALLDRIPPKSLLLGSILALFLLASTPYLLLNRIRPLLPLWEDSSVFFDPTTGKRKILPALDRSPALSSGLDSFLSIFYEGRSVNFTDRRDLYFMGNYDLYDPYMIVGHYLRNTPARQIGLIMDSNDWEYPLWALVNQQSSPGPLKFTHLEVNNVSKSLSSPDQASPELVVVTRKNFQNPDFLDKYQEVVATDYIQIYEPLK